MSHSSDHMTDFDLPADVVLLPVELHEPGLPPFTPALTRGTAVYDLASSGASAPGAPKKAHPTMSRFGGGSTAIRLEFGGASAPGAPKKAHPTKSRVFDIDLSDYMPDEIPKPAPLRRQIAAIGPCVVCHVNLQSYADGVCSECTDMSDYQPRKIPNPPTLRRQIAATGPCVVCHVNLQSYADGICSECFE